MMRYLVKVRFTSGESITFVSRETELDYSEELEEQDHLYFDAAKWPDLLLNEFIDVDDWYYSAIENNSSPIVNFVLYVRSPQASEFLHLPRDHAAELALEKNMSFRVVMENGVEMAREPGISNNRVNVYLNKNIVYRAEVF